MTHVAGVQPSRTSGTTAQPSCHASFSSGGSHMFACESPIRTISFELDAVPIRQIFPVVCELVSRRTHPSGGR